MNLAELAAKNYAEKRAQLNRLHPLKRAARAKVEALQQCKEGVTVARAGIELMSDLRHVPNFFPTPRALVLRMIEEAALEPGMSVLEPSAGKGDIAKAVLRAGINVHMLQCVEFNRTLGEYLIKQGLATWIANFLEYDSVVKFDRVLMNPPFERGVDEDHIRHAFTFLAPGGRLVAIACSTTGAKLESWIADNGGTVEQLPRGTFALSERPTQVNTCLIVI
jgi:predicted RNA methylase